MNLEESRVLQIHKHTEKTETNKKENIHARRVVREAKLKKKHYRNLKRVKDEVKKYQLT